MTTYPQIAEAFFEFFFMRIDCITETVISAIASRVGEYRRAEQSKGKETVFSAMSVLAVVEQRKP